MRRSAALALLLPALLLAGCGPADEPATGLGSEADLATLATIDVAGDLGAAPEVSFTPELVLEGNAVLLVSEGDGEELAEGRSAQLHYVAYGGDSEDLIISTWDYGPAVDVPLDPAITWPELVEALVGQKVGSRVIFALPGAEGATETETYPASFMVIEVTGVRDVPTRAEGTAVTPPAGLPVVTLAENGEPSIEIPADAVEPADLVVQPLIEGAGDLVEAGQTVSFHYSGWLWDGTPFDSSWGRGQPLTSPIGMGRLIDGWDVGLVGRPVGSQVLLVVPADQGYGDTGSGSIPPGATLIFVVDILEIVG